MFKLLSGEWYKIRKSKSFFVCSLIAFGMVFLLYGTLYLLEKGESNSIGTENTSITFEYVEPEETYTDGDNTNDIIASSAETGQEVSQQEPEDAPSSILDVVQTMLGGMIQILTCIFVCIFVVAEYGNGAIKNFTGKGYSRRQVFQSKYVASVMASALMCIICLTASVLLGICFKGTDGLNVEFFKTLFIYAGLQIIMTMVFTGIIVALSEISRSVGIAISTGMVLITFSTLFSSMLDLLFNRFNFKVSDYWIVDLMASCPLTNADGTYLKHMVIASIIWTAASLLIGTMNFNKRDVK